ncbi:alpha/beta fold hydrolase [Candidatus Chloroploca sp. Khr17]|uniref:alpha/beta fold hydrolase n=1 Tax=Candidatus Chloroploca sp. Khr17 TaxID=2496869 RepID=UPI00101CAAA3|nr:alpha/beta hydrolase [Candidatus Chloroploca sp. Khr17]
MHPFPSDAAHRMITVEATRLSYLDWGGTGSPAVLLHGITSSAATLWQVAGALREAGLHPISFDMPGHGLSDVSREHSIDAIARLIGEAMQQLGLAEVTLLGHSWGGATALALASHPVYGKLLRRVVLVDPLLGLDPAWASERKSTYGAGVGGPVEQGLVTVRANNATWCDEDVYWKAIALEQCRVAQVEGLFCPPAAWDLLDRFAQVHVPLLMLVADPTLTVVSPAQLVMVQQGLEGRQAQIEVVPGTSHNMLRGYDYAVTVLIVLRWLEV